MIGFPSVTAATVAGAFIVGIALVLLESFLPLLSKRLSLSESQSEWLVSAQNLTLIPMMFLSGLMIDCWAVKPVLIVGSLLTALAMGSLAVSRTTQRVFVSIMLLGAGGACLSTSASVLMLSAFYPDHAAASQNLGNVFFALGALVAPLLARRLLDQLDYRRALIIVAVACLGPAILGALTVQNAFPPMRQPLSGAGALFQQPVVWFAAVLFLFYLPLEGSLGTWAGRYLHDIGFSPARSERLLVGFWLAFLVSRLLASFLELHVLTGNIGQSWFIVLLALGAAVALGNMAGARKSFSAGFGLILVGLFFGPIFPTLVGILFDRCSEMRGSAFGAMFAVGSTGNLLLPFIGGYARKNTVQRAMRIPMGLALIVALVACILAFYLPIAR
jgi:fucose permease